MPDLGALIVAVAALLIVFAWSLLFSRTLQAARGYVPGIFGPLFDALQGADAAIYNALRGWADLAIQPFSDLLARLAASIDSLVYNPLRFARAVASSLWRAYNYAIPAAIRTAANLTWNLYNDTLARLQALYATVEADLNAARVTLEAGLNGLRADLQSAVALTRNLFQTAESDLAAGVAAAEAQAVGLVASEAARAQALEQAIVNTARSDLNQLAGEVQADLRGVEGLVGTVAHDLTSGLNHLEAQTQAALNAVESSIQAEIESVIKSGPWGTLVAAYAGGEAALKADVEALVRASLRQIRAEITDAGSLRIKYGPQVRAALSALGQR